MSVPLLPSNAWNLPAEDVQQVGLHEDRRTSCASKGVRTAESSPDNGIQFIEDANLPQVQLLLSFVQ